MGAPTILLSAAGILGTVVAVVVDGRRAVVLAVIAVSAGLAPTAAAAGGPPALLPVAGCALAALVLGNVGGFAGRRLPWVGGLDPTIPAFSPRRRLFGPRSVRIFAAAVAVLIASWVSSNVPVGQVTAVEGLLFAPAYAWTCGVLRMLVARTVEDLAVGMAVISLAAGVGWLLRGGDDAYAGAVIACSVPPLVCLVTGWLAGRHSRRPAVAGEPAR